MSVKKVFNTDNPDTFKTKALHWANSFASACYFDSNNYSDPYSAFDVFIAAGVRKEISEQAGNAFSKLQDFLDENEVYVPGYFSYDLKNETEDLITNNEDHLV